MLRINVVTIFPQFFETPLSLSIPAKAAAAGSVSYNLVDLRDYTHDRHRTVDVEALGAKAPIVLLSPRGSPFSHAHAVRYAAGEELTLLCGHYKDVDQRVADHLATEHVSLGDFVLSGG